MPVNARLCSLDGDGVVAVTCMQGCLCSHRCPQEANSSNTADPRTAAHRGEITRLLAKHSDPHLPLPPQLHRHYPLTTRSMIQSNQMTHLSPNILGGFPSSFLCLHCFFCPQCLEKVYAFSKAQLRWLLLSAALPHVSPQGNFK